jgi:hypothetical protein
LLEIVCRWSFREHPFGLIESQLLCLGKIEPATSQAVAAISSRPIASDAKGTCSTVVLPDEPQKVVAIRRNLSEAEHWRATVGP